MYTGNDGEAEAFPLQSRNEISHNINLARFLVGLFA